MGGGGTATFHDRDHPRTGPGACPALCPPGPQANLVSAEQAAQSIPAVSKQALGSKP